MSFDAEAYQPVGTIARERILEGKANALAYGIENAWSWCKANIARA